MDAYVQYRRNFCSSDYVEVLLVEVSGTYNEYDNSKTDFDHYKAVVGSIGNVSTLAGRYEFASFDSLKRSKFILSIAMVSKDKQGDLLSYLWIDQCSIMMEVVQQLEIPLITIIHW